MKVKGTIKQENLKKKKEKRKKEAGLNSWTQHESASGWSQLSITNSKI